LKSSTPKRAGGVAQGVGPKFKPSSEETEKQLLTQIIKYSSVSPR
jgi:hypothetical protein